METALETIAKLLALIVPICGGLLWIIKQNRRTEKSGGYVEKGKQDR